MLTATADAAARPVSAASYVAFRAAFGALAAFSAARFLWRGWVGEFYLSPAHHLTYPRFGWFRFDLVRPWPAPFMYAHVVALLALGLAIAVGFRPRTAAALYAVGFTYVELIDRALYLNHYWFLSLAALLLAVLPGPSFGVDGAVWVPSITVWMLRFQLGVVYFFAGVAKLNPDWLLHGEPLRTWLAARTDRPIFGPLLDEPGVALAASWVGVAFDLTIVGWLLWRRSRPVAYVVLVVFHLATAALFQIGLFPWVMIALTPIFFPSDWPQRFRSFRPAARAGPTARPLGYPLLGFVAVFVVLSLIVPLRHWAREGNVRWNDDGYELSWRVMLTDRAGFLEFEVLDERTGREWRVEPDMVLSEWQAYEAQSRPQLALRTAHLIAAEFDAMGYPGVDVRADSFVAMNGRLRQRMIDPAIDLTDVPDGAPAARYVLPLDPPVVD